MGRNRSNATAPAVKGNLVAGTGADTSGLLTVGANDTVLTADSSTATGLKWATVSAGMVSLASASFPTNVSTVTISSISGSYRTLILLLENFASPGTNAEYRLRVNGDTGLNYSRTFMETGNTTLNNESNFSYWSVARGMPSTSNPFTKLVLEIPFYTNTNSRKSATWIATTGGATTSNGGGFAVGNYASTSAITSLTIFTETGNFASGTYTLFGAN